MKKPVKERPRPAFINPRTGRPDRRIHDATPVDTLTIAFFEYLGSERRRLPRTVREYVRDVELLGAFLQGRDPTGDDDLPYRGPFGDVFRNATPSDLRRYLMHMHAKRYGAVATMRKLAVLRRFFWLLKRDGVRPDDPTADILNVKLPKRLPKAIPFRDVMRLISTRPPAGQSEQMHRRDRAILELFYASGIRRAELVGINVGDVDFETRMIRVIGKGNKQRSVLFDRATSAALHAYLRLRPRCEDGALFVSKQGRRLSYQQVGRIFARYVRLSGLEGKITPHTMRHSIATHLHQSGADLMTVKDFLGHESIQTTQVYAEMTMDHVRRSYEKYHLRDRAESASRTPRKRGRA